MSNVENNNCPECAGEFDLSTPDVGREIDRRNFIRVLGGTTAIIAGTTLTSVSLPATARAAAPPMPEVKPKPAEDLIRELFSGLSEAQKKRVVRPWNYGARGTTQRLGMYNSPIDGIQIQSIYTPTQQELIGRIVKSMCSGDDGYRRISRGGKWDGSGALNRCGALIYGNPVGKDKFSFVFAGHHLTIRADGNSEEGAAFGGPMYYGHSPHGYSRGNLFFYQTRAVMGLYGALSGAQRDKATVKRGKPGEGIRSVQFKARAEDRPGLRTEDLTGDQKKLVEEVMRNILSPYRKEDVDNVMAIVRKNGGMDKVQFAFYPDGLVNDKEPWHFWRLEGPGFVWNYRILPHVHCYVNIALQAPAPAQNPAPRG
jgi:hypothetical protein